ncbi:HNH endonuclease signature motif containing protein [Pseudomonas taiwanensis]|uniref:HNH endonuclease n=1 Tax=Pseudomonas taiwanensis TaxID=470150 RepID=UPI0028E08B3E|nr:HNH endonuclease signature motif containing protein [Pseudomonas taiwanensis]MDT8924766.1 HNH endonuclease signature motif containing protein [Pseudomonas taiwanensis]
MNTELKELLRPKMLSRVYDTVAAVGISVQAWHNVSPKITPPANPKFCYRWAFEGDSKVLLFLWFAELTFTDSGVEYIGNARQARNRWEERANDARDASVKQRLNKWRDSAEEMDNILKLCNREGREVRIALVDTKQRVFDEDNRASADYRALDPEPWHLVHYEMQDGSFHVRRGRAPLVAVTADSPAEDVTALHADHDPFEPSMPQITASDYGVGVVDQFVGAEQPLQKTVLGLVWERSALVRQRVLARSGGFCEYCAERGFLKANGDIYLETHHVVGLCEGGADTEANVIALCPNHHREAHYGARCAQLRAALQQIITEKLAVMSGSAVASV